MPRLLPVLMLLAAVNAEAVTLNLCPAATAPEGAMILDSTMRPSGEELRLFLHANPVRGCASISIDNQPIWGRLLDRSATQRLRSAVMLQTAQNEPRTAMPQDVIPPDPVAAATSRSKGEEPGGATLLPGEELVKRLQASTFGDEGRARLSRSGELMTLECAAGERPAGALLRGHGMRLPAGAHLALRMDAESTAPFRVAAADAAGDARGESQTLGVLEGARSNLQLDLPPSFNTALWRSWVLECPLSQARATIQSLQLAAAGTGKPKARGLWIWQPEYWMQQQDRLFALLAAHEADTAYITVPLRGDPAEVQHVAELQQFIADAERRGLRVWAVAGDPRALLPGERQKYAALAAALANYNRGVPATSRLAGLQLDIEPYLNRGYAHDPEGWLSAYVETLALIRPRAEMPIDVAVPFWWGRQRLRGGLFLDALKPLVDVVTVMNYRTDPGQLMRFAEPFLSWSATHGKQVRIGLEIGPIPDESLHVYRRAGAGDLWLANIGTQHAVLLMLDGPRTNPAGPSYVHSHTIHRTGDLITFRRNPELLRKLLPQLEALWRAWPSFAGVALHGLDQD